MFLQVKNIFRYNCIRKPNNPGRDRMISTSVPSSSPHAPNQSLSHVVFKSSLHVVFESSSHVVFESSSHVYLNHRHMLN